MRAVLPRTIVVVMTLSMFTAALGGCDGTTASSQRPNATTTGTGAGSVEVSQTTQAQTQPLRPQTVASTTKGSLVEGMVQALNDGRMWVIAYQTRRLCLPPGLFRKEGLRVRLDAASIVPLKPNERRACLSFDYGTLQLVERPQGLNTMTLTVGGTAEAPTLTTTRRVAVGPAADGVATVAVCWPAELGAQPGATVRLTGYPLPKDDKAACEPWVFIKQL